MTVTGSSPDAATRERGPKEAVNRIVPSAPHAPPRGAEVLAKVCGGPPAISMRFSLPAAVYAIDRLSGDQNG